MPIPTGWLAELAGFGARILHQLAVLLVLAELEVRLAVGRDVEALG